MFLVEWMWFGESEIHSVLHEDERMKDAFVRVLNAMARIDCVVVTSW